MFTKEEKTIIYQTIKIYLIVYVLSTLMVMFLTMGHVFNNIAMIPIVILALKKIKERNMLVMKTIFITSVAIISLFFIYSLFASKPVYF